MTDIKFIVTGTTKWLAGIVEQVAAVQPLTFNGEPATALHAVTQDDLAWVSIYFWGDPGTPVTLAVIRQETDGSETGLAKRSYKIDPDGSAARSVQFDPNAARGA